LSLRTLLIFNMIETPVTKWEVDYQGSSFRLARRTRRERKLTARQNWQREILGAGLAVVFVPVLLLNQQQISSFERFPLVEGRQCPRLSEASCEVL